MHSWENQTTIKEKIEKRKRTVWWAGKLHTAPFSLNTKTSFADWCSFVQLQMKLSNKPAMTMFS